MCVVNGSWDLHVLYSDRKWMSRDGMWVLGAACWTCACAWPRPTQGPFPRVWGGGGLEELGRHGVSSQPFLLRAGA